MIDCARADALIEARIDGQATAAEDRWLDAHVAGCPACAARLEAESALDAALAARFARSPLRSRRGPHRPCREGAPASRG